MRLCQHLPAAVVPLVAIHPPQHDRPPVVQQLPPCHLSLPEAHLRPGGRGAGDHGAKGGWGYIQAQQQQKQRDSATGREEAKEQQMRSRRRRRSKGGGCRVLLEFLGYMCTDLRRLIGGPPLGAELQHSQHHMRGLSTPQAQVGAQQRHRIHRQLRAQAASG